MVFTTQGLFEELQKVCLSVVWTHDQWIPFGRSNWLSYKVRSSSRIQPTLYSCSSFTACSVSLLVHFIYCLRQSSRFLNWNFLEVITSVLWNELMDMVFTTEGLFGALKGFPEWDLNPRPLGSWIQLALRQLCTATTISLLVQCHILFPLLPSSVATVIWIESFLM